MAKTIPNQFSDIFVRLRAILQQHAGALSVTDDSATRYCVAGGLHPKHKQPMPIAWVQIGKGYVSFHLMPVYGCLKLLDGFSPKLKARMQGKSCFNFKSVDEELFSELDRLTVAGFAVLRKVGYLPEGKPA